MADPDLSKTKPANHDRTHTILRWLEYTYLMRFPLSAVAILVGLPCGFLFAPAMFVGLFDAAGFFAFMFVVWMEFQLAWSIMVTIRLILTYGRDRFDSLKKLGAHSPHPLKWRHVFGFVLLAAPVLATTWVGTQGLVTWTKLGGTALGITGSILIVFAATVFHFRIEHGGGNTAEKILPTLSFAKHKELPFSEWLAQRSSFWKTMDTIFSELPHELTDGLMKDIDPNDETKGRYFRSGHEMAFVVFLLLAAMYGLVGLFYSPSLVSGSWQPAALFFLLLLITLATWFF